MKTELIMLVCLLLVGLLVAGGIYILGLDDNPDNATSRALAERSANKYLSKHHPDSDYEVNSIVYDEKDERYSVTISSDKSADSWFILEYDSYGKLINNNYEDRVAKRGNTAARLSREYGAAINEALEPVFDDGVFRCYAGLSYTTSDLAQRYSGDDGEFIISDGLELDGVYNIAEFGKAGWVTIEEKVDGSLVTEQRLAELLLNVRQTLDQAGLSFHHITCTLDYPCGTYSKRLNLKNFLYEDIYEDGLVERVTEALNSQAYK